ncbi:hypothetical protein FE391_44440 [Nonomuraea sp. KC401]|uniref:hypothetical protein n=1 Tax=unclassified Nonomuraea TaxID=2593643 RepID=UPI0010FE0323|nr:MULTISPECIES: hypothetical protein [unclassified Nonomuraea]NBF00334.1 hypothetical protein [Nonomuraea sp. K271]TLF51668.1 hypothetical protein FE391_44440 [Nonomuraea sp. KC401]
MWRTARPSDLVCVAPTVRDQVRNDNRVKVSRWTNGEHGPHTCETPYVWREAFPGDDVCVELKERTQAKRDNLQADDRKILARLWVTKTKYQGETYITLNGDHFNLGKVKLSIRIKKTNKEIYGATVTAFRYNGQAGGSLGVMTDLHNCGKPGGIDAYAVAYDTRSGRWSSRVSVRPCATL